ncbi:MAG: hypothetical protein IT367_18165 [Candidatus Hydrogenedentes bacterium]|nr:hypothetical protein [Candidatus Hydrogenedentota bacterium]
MSAAATNTGLRRPQYAGFLCNEELERLALDELRADVLYALRSRSLTSVDWWRVREEAHAPGLEIGEMNIAQLRALVSAIEQIPVHRVAQAPAVAAKPKARAGKPFGWAQR